MIMGGLRSTHGRKNTKHTPFYWKHVTQQTVRRTYAKMSV